LGWQEEVQVGVAVAALVVLPVVLLGVRSLIVSTSFFLPLEGDNMIVSDMVACTRNFQQEHFYLLQVLVLRFCGAYKLLSSNFVYWS
jgi:hypothetical protein